MGKVNKLYEIPEIEKISNGRLNYFAILPVDLSSIQTTITSSSSGIHKLGIDEEDITEISILIDELLSNAMLATAEIGNKEKVYFHLVADNKSCKLYILDYGGGISMENIINLSPRGKTSDEFLKELAEYQHNTTIDKEGVRTSHARFGKGLTIVSKLSDILEIMFHNSKGDLFFEKNNDCIGTLFIAHYHYKFTSTNG